jgi:hypothetical protein
MPQLTVRGISIEKMAAISSLLVKELAMVCECGTDNFTLDCLPVTSVFDGHGVETYPFIEVAWFERGNEVRDRFAEVVTRHVRLAGIVDVEVAFKVYQEDAYYINGLSCK